MNNLYYFIEKILGMDKVAHFFGIAYISLFISLLFAHINAGYTPLVYATEGAIAGVIVAITKEVFDFMNNRKADMGDFIAGAVGSVMSFFIAGILL